MQLNLRIQVPVTKRCNINIGHTSSILIPQTVSIGFGLNVPRRVLESSVSFASADGLRWRSATKVKDYNMAKHHSSAKAIAELNDEFRRFNAGNGSRYITCGVKGKGPEFVIKALASVQEFSTFNNDNDPHGHRDFGSLSVDGERIFWKIDYYDKNLEYGSEDPADPSKTHRVFTIMLPLEY